MCITFGVKVDMMKVQNITSTEHSIAQDMIAPNLSQMIGFDKGKNIKRWHEVVRLFCHLMVFATQILNIPLFFFTNAIAIFGILYFYSYSTIPAIC